MTEKITKKEFILLKSTVPDYNAELLKKNLVGTFPNFLWCRSRANCFWRTYDSLFNKGYGTK